MENLGEIINSYFPLESVLSNISYDSSRFIQWTCAVLGAFLVGLSGVVPLLIMPDTTKRKKSISHKDTNDTVCSIPHENSDDHNRSSRTLFRRQSTVEHFSQIDENEDNMSQENNELTLNRYLSFAVGGLLGDICLHLLPEIYSSKIDSSIIYDEGRQLRLGLSILAGILSFLAIEKLFDITQVRTDITLPQVAINVKINDYLIDHEK